MAFHDVISDKTAKSRRPGGVQLFSIEFIQCYICRNRIETWTFSWNDRNHLARKYRVSLQVLIKKTFNHI